MDRIAHFVATDLVMSSPAVAQTVQAAAQLYNGGDKRFELKEAAKNMNCRRQGRHDQPGTVRGHASAGESFLEDVELLNRETGAFLNDVPESRKKLQ